MEVLHIIGALDPSFGGPVFALNGLVRAQLATGLSVRVASSVQAGESEAVADQMKVAGAAVELIGPARTKLRWHPSMSRQVDRCVRTADVVHIHGVWESIHHVAARKAHARSKPYLVRPCGMLDPWSLRQSRLQKKLMLRWRVRHDLAQAASIHYTSEAERDLSHGALGTTFPSIVIPNGLDLSGSDALPLPGEFRAQIAEIGDRRIVLFLSRVHVKKGIELLLPAMRLLNDKRLVLVIVGPGDEAYINGLRAMAGEQGIADQVIFAGMRTGREKLAAYQDADLFVLPSYQENFGNVVVEAIASGTPVMISDQVNIHGDVTAMAAGVVVPLDVEAIAAGIRRALDDVPLQERVKAHGRQLVAGKWSWPTIAAQWKEEYLRLCRRNGQNG